MKPSLLFTILIIVANKYRSINLIIFYYYIYSEWLDTIDIIIQNSMRLIRNTEFDPQVDE